MIVCYSDFKTTTDKNMFKLQVEYFQDRVARCNSWYHKLNNELLQHGLPKDLIIIVDDYSNANFQVKSWYVKLCQDFLRTTPLSENTHFVSSSGELEELICTPKLTFENDQVEIIWIAHQERNAKLLEGTVHSGCSDMGVGCSDDCEYCRDDSDIGPCVWEYGFHRCRCGNYKGFEWEISENFNWMNFSLFSNGYVGRQVRAW